MAKSILDQSTRVQQLLSELTYRACQIGKQIQAFEENSAKHILGLSRELEKERKQSRKFDPIYDRAKFLQWNGRTLSRLNKALLRLFLEIRLYEEKLQRYQSTIGINSEVAHG
jgi:hypothetical protein